MLLQNLAQLLFTARYKGYRGVIQLRTLVLVVDPRAQSPGESILRLRWLDTGLPRPECQVADGTPARAAGIKAGDVILRVNGQLIADTDELRHRLATSSEDVTLTVMRDKKELALKARIEKPKAPEAPSSNPKRIIR